MFFGFLAEDNGIPLDEIFFSKAVYLVSGNNYYIDREIDPNLSLANHSEVLRL